MKNSRRSRAVLCSILTIGLQASTCSSRPDDKVTPNGSDAAQKGPLRIPWPQTDRIALRDTELPPFVLNDQGFAGSGRFNGIFWLDFEGATVKGEDSFIVKKAGLDQTVIPEFASADIGSNEDRQALKVTIVQDLVALFPDVDIKFSLSRPVESMFSHVHIGGDNFTGKPGVLGIAPLDLGNRVGNDILFIYSKVLKDAKDPEAARIELTHAIAHEIAHSLGARHIDNDLSIMRTAVSVEAKSFDQSGPVVEEPNDTENSLTVLLNSAGSKSALLKDGSLPEIVTLDAFTTSGIIQYTVISQKNILQNPAKSLMTYTYKWEYEGKTAEGTSVLLSFNDADDHALKLTVSDSKNASRQFDFIVGHNK